MHPYDIIFVGLSLDVVCAVVLAKSFMLKDAQDAYYEVLPTFGGNRALVKSAIVQRGEAWVGAGLLLSGFLLQIWGNLHGGIAASQAGWGRLDSANGGGSRGSSHCRCLLSRNHLEVLGSRSLSHSL